MAAEKVVQDREILDKDYSNVLKMKATIRLKDIVSKNN